jgi:hypothetical protein
MSYSNDPPRLFASAEAPVELQRVLDRAYGAPANPAEVTDLVHSVESAMAEAAAAHASSLAPAADVMTRVAPWSGWAAKVGLGVCALALVGGLAAVARHARPSDPAIASLPAAVIEPSASLGAAAEPPSTAGLEPIGTETSVPGAELPAPAGSQASPAEPSDPRPPRSVVASRPLRGTAQKVEEYRILRAARQSLGKNPERALALTAEHRRRFKDGMLAQEREAIAIDALARLGRKREAEARHDVLVREHPESPYRERLPVTREPRK